MDKDCAHAQLVTRDGDIEITVSALHRHMYAYIYKNCTPVARLGGLAPARPIMVFKTSIYIVGIYTEN